jgi:hypothetical protein
MRIIELILDEAQSMMGIEAISIVENPAIEENFLALKSDEIKLAEVNKEKKILMGALLIPNKPIYRKSGEDEYYIYFSKDTVEKASQLYLKNGNQNNSTLEHKHELNGLTLVESWIVEDEKFDKSRKYGLNVPVGTWMGAVKVNNDDVWNEYVKTGKVKGFSIEGYFADKMERPKDNTTGLSEQKADLLLSKITSIVKGERVELSLIDDLEVYVSKAEKYDKESKKLLDSLVSEIENKTRSLGNLSNSGQAALDTYLKIGKQIKAATKELGIDLPPKVAALTKKLTKYTTAVNQRASIGGNIIKASK